ncbi:MAG: biotin/lipoyl-containing protein [Cyclobacteriaceae bacterium]
MKLLKGLIIPHDSVNDDKVLIIKLQFSDGDFVKKGAEVIEFETSKAVTTLEAEDNGYILYRCKEGDNVLIGEVVAEIYDEYKGAEFLNLKKEFKKEDKKDKPDIKTIFSSRAKQFLVENKIKEILFKGHDFVSLDDAKLLQNKLKNNLRSDIGVVSKNRPSLSPIKPTAQVSKQSIYEFDKNNKEKIIVACPSRVGMEVIWDIMEDQVDKEIVGYVADDEYKSLLDLPFLNCNVFDFPLKIDKGSYHTVIIAMGGSLQSMRFRKKVFEHYSNEGIKFTNVISNKANIGNGIRIGSGNVIGSGVFIGTGSSIGDNNFISYMTVIGHHNIIGDNNLFAPGVMMSGLVEVGDDCILTTGINFIDKVKIGNRVILPLGYNVVSDIADDTVIKIKN